MKTDKILVKVTATIAVLLVVLLFFYFATVKTASDGSWGHTYFPGSILFFCVFGLTGFFIRKRKNKLSNSLPKEKQKIGKISSMPDPSIYRRSSGKTYLKLNENYHVKTKKVNGIWLGDGLAETLDAEEEVELIH